MIDNYEHYITRNIKAFYKRRLLSPILYLILLALIWLAFPLSEMRHPVSFEKNDQLKAFYTEKSHYVSISIPKLTFSGFTQERFGKTVGYYYYSEIGDQLVIVLLKPSTCEQGLPQIENLDLAAQIKPSDNGYRDLLEEVSKSLSWTKEGILAQMTPYYISELEYNSTTMVALFLIYYGTLIYSILTILCYILYIIFPVLSPPCLNLSVYGNAKKQLEQAEEELATLPQLATEDMFITEHYFIVSSIYGTAIIPIHEMLWIYKYSTLHKFLWYHFSISYTLHIQATHHMYIRCPKNIKSDIDGIMDYLAEANHNILVGFSEENRLKVQAAQGKPFHIERLIALLHRRI